MESIEAYLEILPLPVLLGAAILVVGGYLLLLGQSRLFVSLLILPPWLTLAQLPGLGPIQGVAKISSSLAFLLVAASAILHQGPRRPLPTIVWLYPIMGFFGIFYILGVEERFVAFALRVQWFALTLAAIALARTMVTAQDVTRVVKAIALGCVISVMLPLSALLLAPGEAFLKGRNRFQPWGVNSNQIGILFALTVPLVTYVALTTRRVVYKPVLLFTVAITIGMALITGSRQTMLIIAFVTLPIIFKLSQRPVLTITALGVGLLGVSWLLGMAETDALQRFTLTDTGRLEIFLAYVDVVKERPFFGLLGTQGLSVFKDPSVGLHPHNSYMWMVYLGGLSYALPMIALVVYSSICTFRVWLGRNRYGLDPLLTSVLATLLLAIYLQGLANQVAYWPTYTWSFLHVVLAVMFIAIARDVRELGPEAALPDADAEAWAVFDDEYADEYADEYGDDEGDFAAAATRASQLHS